MNKKLVALVIALAVLVAALAVVYFVTRPSGTEGMKAFTVEVIHKDGTTKKLNLKSDAEFLNQALEAEKLVEYFEGQPGYIKTIDGEDAIYEDGGYFWAFYINGETAMVGVLETPITDGAVYTFKNTNEMLF